MTFRQIPFQDSPMPEFAVNPRYLAYQYGAPDKLRIRQEAHEQFSERPNDFFDWALAHFDLRPGLTVLDVGCGPGAYHSRLHAAGCRVIALDRSYGMVEAAQGQAAQQGLPVAALQGDAQALPLADASVERVMANHMLYHVPDQAAALAEMRRVLKSGGLVMLTTNAADRKCAVSRSALRGCAGARLYAGSAHDRAFSPWPFGAGASVLPRCNGACAQRCISLSLVRRGFALLRKRPYRRP
jgi:SAM-dependent methyltransferase